MTPRYALIVSLLLVAVTDLLRSEELPKLTTLSDASIKYAVPSKPYVVLRGGDVEAVIVDNQAADDEVLPGHRAGYSGVASLKHAKQKRNIFVPLYAGLNYEHIHDGTVQHRDILFEPRRASLKLRVVNDRIAELYQAPTPHWGLESCLRYELLDDGAIEMTLECIPHRKTFANGYIGLFWASYINQPESLDIHLKGYSAGSDNAQWLRGVTPKHGVLSTHVGTNDKRQFKHAEDFPLTLAFNRSRYRYAEPWYYGVSHGMALAFVFRDQDMARLTQSPSGGGQGNPAWDFQYFFSDYKVGQRYQAVMRALYVPFESREQMEKATKPHRDALRL
ncbi:MAG: hypothetical protein CMJ64_29910 [Planctomycetaceae bacterium]|jgi:hypothetical protein|nr:hypothetical protein [Planctomycetaceae bacterium]